MSFSSLGIAVKKLEYNDTRKNIRLHSKCTVKKNISLINFFTKMEGIFSGLCTMLQVRTLIHEVKLIILKSNHFLLSMFNNEFRKTYHDEFWTLFTAFFVKMSGLF